ncbi:TPA: hypothetical protein N0F65_008339 [Lagenidium giganteum]|uniref:AB hydrolase-1 domain-containing protein n=1 Tax=Lagenidium giganteum TaxID=4803 RepID=A0AAV2YN68_9STRA|nr:TPA: hypothetical protein N0F65_008339 [Lagenidium giganteum]
MMQQTEHDAGSAAANARAGGDPDTHMTMDAAQETSGLSWQEVKEICAEMEQLYMQGARKDPAQLRSLIRKRNEITATVQARQAESQTHLQQVLAGVREWEQQEATARARHEQMKVKLQEIENLKREMAVQLERLRIDEQYPFSVQIHAMLLLHESLDELLTKYESTRQEVMQYNMEHQNDVPRAKHQMSLYASVTGIKWDFSGTMIAGDIHVPTKQSIVRFEFDPSVARFDAANALWDKIDEAFDDASTSILASSDAMTDLRTMLAQRMRSCSLLARPRDVAQRGMSIMLGQKELQPTDPMPRNKYKTVVKKEFPLVCGGSLPEVEIEWEQWGDCSLPGERTILVLPSFSHSSHAASNRDDPRPGWWQNMVGPGMAINTSYFRVICPSVLGSPFGATSPLKKNPTTGKPYRASFPQITPADMAAAHALVLDDLGIDKVHAVVGGSMGGMQALEFAAQFSDRLERLVAIACTAQTTPGTVAFRRVQRRAIMSDPAYNNGDYEEGIALEGMKVARELGMTCYRSREEFDKRFNWKPTGKKHFKDITFDVESYMEYQAEKFARYYDPNCYLLLSKAMDLTDVGRGFTNMAEGLRRISCESLIIGVEQDLLVPIQEQAAIVDILQSYGYNSKLISVNSKFGHDAMFHSQMQRDVFTPMVREFIERDMESTLSHEQHRYSSL